MQQSIELDFAIKTAKKAGKILMGYYGKVDYKLKSKRSLVTEADKESEKFILGKIKKEFPEHGIIAEESGGTGSLEFTWHVDPLDGTKNFAHSFPYFCVSIALVKKENPILGAVFNPYTKELFHAEKGRGSFFNGRKISVSRTNRIEDALVVYGMGNTDEAGRKMIDIMNIFVFRAQGARFPGAAALSTCQLAAGSIDAYFEPEIFSWDIAAGCIILKEAGGKITGFDGSEYRLGQKSYIASNGLLHKEILKLLNKK